MSATATELHIDISGAGQTAVPASWPAFFAPGTSVIALPNWDTPRLLLPAAPRSERWQGSRLYPAFRLRAKAFRLLLRAAAVLSVLPARTVEADEWELQPILDTYLPETSTLSVLIGTPGAGQKLTTECRNDDGEVVGYLKYAEGSVAMAQMRNEADVLQALPPGAGPDFIGCTLWHNGLLLITRPVQGNPVQAQLPPPERLPDFARSLQRSDPRRVHEHPWVRRTRASDRVAHALRALENRAWSTVIQHGDLAAWNIRRSAGGLQAFDWEYGNLDGFPYLDIAHFILQHSALIARWPAEKGTSETASYIRSASRDDLSAEEAKALVQLAAYDAYLNDPAPDTNGLQQWRQRIWRDAS